MDDKQKFVLIIAALAAGFLLMAGGTAVLMYVGDTSDTLPNNKVPDVRSQNSWFNGSRHINGTEGWAYINLAFPLDYTGERWDVNVFGIDGDSRVYIYSMDSYVNSSANGVKLNLKHNQILQFECFIIEVTVQNESQTEQICLEEFEIMSRM